MLNVFVEVFRPPTREEKLCIWPFGFTGATTAEQTIFQAKVAAGNIKWLTHYPVVKRISLATTLRPLPT